jgi:hypothetical protein
VLAGPTPQETAHRYGNPAYWGVQLQRCSPRRDPASAAKRKKNRVAPNTPARFRDDVACPVTKGRGAPDGPWRSWRKSRVVGDMVCHWVLTHTHFSLASKRVSPGIPGRMRGKHGPQYYGVYWVKKRGTVLLTVSVRIQKGSRGEGRGCMIKCTSWRVANEFVPTQDPSALGFRIMSVSSGHCESQDQCQSWQCKQGRPFQGPPFPLVV